jgi:26S proteasome regulatory subunit N12
LAPDVGTEKQVFLLSREAVELGAYWAIKSKDVAAFQRYMAQVHTYYFDIKYVCV